MLRNSDRFDRLEYGDRAEYVAARDEFCRRWSVDPEHPPQIADFLTARGPLRRTLLIELIRIDMQARHWRGEQKATHDYCNEYPELSTDADGVRELNDWHNTLSVRTDVATPTDGEKAPSISRTALWRRAGDVGAEDSPPELSGFTIGERIAKGGMGVVWRCRDLLFGRELAIKVMKNSWAATPNLVARFEQEARICGQLAHPFIVPVHSMGRLTDQRPYYTMKLVQGQTLADRLGHRTTRSQELMELIRIFAQVCQAMAFAHSRGIIHRDLKPANVMVGAHGEVQVMDWGLAKLLRESGVPAREVDRPDSAVSRGSLREEESVADVALSETSSPSRDADEEGLVEPLATEAGVALGTYAYMPPEQACGHVTQVDQRADVFGLGSILCEILTRAPAYTGRTTEEIGRRARSGDLAETVSRLRSVSDDRKRKGENFTGSTELEELAMRCLAVDRNDRPRDAGEVARAVANYLTGVEERLEQERLERQKAQVKVQEERRRRRTVLTAATVVLVALALGTVTSVTFLLRERAALKRAEDSFAFLTEDFLGLADPIHEPRRDLTVREAVDRAVPRLANKFADSPATEADLRIAFGKVYFNLGEYTQARDLFEAAHGIASKHLGDTAPTAMTALDQLGNTCYRLNDFERAETLLVRAYELQCKVLGLEHEDTVHTYAKLGDLAWKMGLKEKSLEITERVLEIRRRNWGDEYEFTIVSMNGLGLIYLDADRADEALPLFKSVERLGRKRYHEDHSWLLSYRHNLALCHMALKHWPVARTQFEDIVNRKEQVLGDRHLSTLETEQCLAGVLFELGEAAEARRRIESIQQRLPDDLPEDHTFRGVLLLRLGKCCCALNQLEESRQSLESAVALLQKKLGPAHRLTRAAVEALESLSGRDTAN